MFARFLLGTVTACAMLAPALAGTMTAEEARRFVAGKVFAFTCVDGTRGAGRILARGESCACCVHSCAIRVAVQSAAGAPARMPS